MRVIKAIFLILIMLFVTNSFAVEVSDAVVQSNSVLNSLEINSISASTPAKSQIFTFILAWFFGYLGFHYFYLGYKNKGYLRLFTYLGTIAAIFLGGVFAALNLAFLAIIFYLSALFMLLAIFILNFIDVINILSGDLKPADGSDYTT